MAIKLVSPNFRDIFEPNIEIGQFPDGDSHIRIPNLESYTGQEVFLFHRLYPNQNNTLVELFLILDVLREQNCKVTLCAPYLPYARQDKKKLDGEIPSGQVLCNLLTRAGCVKFVTFDCHFLNEEGEVNYHGLIIKNISMSKVLIEHARKFFGAEAFEVIAPDSGAAYLVKDAGGKFMQKIRKEYDKGVIGYRDIETLYCEFDVKDKNVLLLDDMISTGSTIIKALEKMRVCGARRLCCATTHGLFLYNCLDKIRKLADCVFSTNTIPSDQSKVSIKEKIETLVSDMPKLF